MTDIRQNPIWFYFVIFSLILYLVKKPLMETFTSSTVVDDLLRAFSITSDFTMFYAEALPKIKDRNIVNIDTWMYMVELNSKGQLTPENLRQYLSQQK